jgi:protein-disulfide isomerase
MTDLSTAPVPPLDAEDHIRGSDAAPVVLFYGDFTCPRCLVAQARLRAEPVRVAFRHFALRAKHPRGLALAHAAEAAALQDAFWPFHDALYADPGRIDDPHLWDRVRVLGLDLDRFESDRRSDAVAARVQRDVRGAMRAGVVATPTLLQTSGLPWPGSDIERS